MIENEVNMALNSTVGLSWIEDEILTISQAKSGIWGFGSHRQEQVGKYATFIYNIDDLKMSYMNRDEHLVARESEQATQKNTINDGSSQCLNTESTLKDGEKTATQNGSTLLDAIVLKTILANQLDIIANDLMNKLDRDKSEEGDERRLQRERALQEKINGLILNQKLTLLRHQESLSPPILPDISFEQYFFPHAEMDDNHLSPKKERLGSLTERFENANFSDTTDTTVSTEKSTNSRLSGKETNLGILDAQKYYMGRPMHIIETSKSFKATVWMTEEFPIRFQQLLPLFDIMASNNVYLGKIRHFIELALPPGFPVKLGN